MKRIVLSIISIIVLVMMMLPVIPAVAAPDTLTLRPDGTSDEDLSDDPGSGANHTYVDEGPAHDGDGSYVYTTDSSWERDRYTLSDTSQTGTINSVTVYIVAKRESGSYTPQASARTYLRTGGDTFYGSEVTLTTDYATYSTAYAVNPDTTSAWTWSEINDLRPGVSLRRAGRLSSWPYTRFYSRCTQVYVVVNYTPACTVTINQAGGQDDPTSSSPINFDVVFSEAVSDFVTGDVVLSGTAGATTAVVSGTGTTYNVAVSGMTSSGTVIADIPAGVATGDTSGDPNVASTSTDNTVAFVNCAAVEVQLAMILDGSGSIGSSDWNIMRTGLAAAVENSGCVPQDGTVELTIIQFADNISGGARLEVGPVVITASNAAAVAAQIQAISQAGGWTPLACGIYLAADTLAASPCFDTSLKQAINIVTDGEPNRCCSASYDVSTCSTTDARASAVTARNYAISLLGMTDPQDEIDAEFIGTADGASAWLRDYIVFPQPGDYAPPFDAGEGWVRVVADATEFADTICEKFRVIVCPTVTVDDVSVCSGATATLEAIITGTCTVTGYQWYEGTSSGGTIIPAATNSTYQTTIAGSYTCKVTCDNGCTAEDYGTVTVNPSPTADAGDDETICDGGSVQIGGTNTASGGTSPYTYSWLPITDLDNATIANPTASPSSTETYTVTVTDDNGCTDTDSMTVTVNPSPTADAGGDEAICDGGSVEIGGTPTASGGTSPYTYSWTPTAGLNNPALANPMASPTSTETYTVTVTDANGCTDTDTTDVTVNPNPTVTVADVTVCDGETATLTADISGSPCTVTSYQWYQGSSVATGTIITGADSSTYQTTTAGDYTCEVACATGCKAEDYGTVTVNPKPTANAGPDRTIYYGNSVQIGGAPTASGGTPPYTYSWTPTIGLNNPTIANPTASPTSTTTYTVTVTDANGCSDSDSMRVTVQRETPPCPDVGPYGTRCFFYIDMLGEETMVEVECCSNRVLGTRVAPDPNDMHFLEVERDTLVICEDCTGCECYPQVVVMSLAEESPPPPDDKVIVGPVYYFTGYRDIERLIVCAPVTFNSPISMVLSYDPDELPLGAHSPVIAYYDTDLGYWVELSPDPGRVAEVGKIAVLADYFKSPFAILVEVTSPPTTPVAFSLSNLQIVPSQSKIWQVVTFIKKSGEEVTITADITNNSGQEGSYTAILKINGEVRGTRELVLGPGQSEQVVFTVSDNEPGQYTVVLGSLSGEFTTSLWINWWLIGGIIAALILLGWLVWYRRRKRRAKLAS